jgi:hypothetical protein
MISLDRRTPRGNRFYARALLNPPATPRDSWTIPWRRASMGALNGHGNAPGIATAQSVLASGGVGDVQLMSDAGRHRMLEHETAGLDLVLDIPLRWGMVVLPEQRNRARVGRCPRRPLGWRRWLHVVRRSRPPLQLRLRPQPMDHRRTRAGPQPPPPNQFYLAL